MSLADALASETTKPKGPRCTMCVIIEDLQPKDREALLAALADDRFSTVAIARALKSEGHGISSYTVSRHRRGECLGDTR